MQTGKNRPLSPHLQVYRPMLTMMMSIAHRITGAALYFAVLLLAWWLVALAAGPSYFNFVEAVMTSFFGRLVMFLCTFALVHHLMGGLKHLLWDTGRGFDLKTVEKLALGSIIASVLITFAIWALAYAVK